MSCIDINDLFHSHTIEEIKLVERQIRGDVEKRKEELRTLVGERYRDLINAADTIQDMKGSANEIFAGIASISESCSNFSFHSDIIDESSSSHKSNDETFYSLATQMNLLVDTPEKIWSTLDNHQYLLACQYYLLSQHIVNASLNIGQTRKTVENRDLYASFPILHHQWAAISHFKPSILKGSINSLKDCLLPDQVVAENLCAVSLLDNYSPRQVFTEFLMARKAALQDIFHSSLHSKSVKSQICDVVYLIQLTLQQVISLFYADENSTSASTPLYYHALNQHMKNSQNKGRIFQELFGDEMDAFSVKKYIPENVVDFVPKLRVVAVSISMSYIQTHVNEWIKGCLTDVEKGVTTLLSYVSNIKGLSAIRDSVYQLLSQNSDREDVIDEENPLQNWLQCCQITLNRSLNIWDEFLRNLYFKRAKEVVCNHLEISFTSLWESLDSVLLNLMDYESAVNETCWDHDLITYMWYDFPQASVSLINPNAKEFDNMLSLKSKAYTPVLKSVCDQFNESLQNCLHDMKYFMNIVEEQGADEVHNKIQMLKKDVSNLLYDGEDLNEAFKRFADAADMKMYLTSTFNENINKICGKIDETFITITDGLNKQDISSPDKTMLLDKTTFLSRFCCSLTDLCSNIQLITDYDVTNHALTNPLLLRKTQRYTSKHKKTSSQLFSDIQKLLNDKSEFGFSIWCNCLIDFCKSSVEKIFSCDLDLLILSTTNWEVVSIKEEGETGDTMHSSIKVPGQISFYLSSLLYRLSEELHRSAAYVVNKRLVSNMMSSICALIFKCHSEKIKSSSTMYQNRILQMLFDVKFLLKLCIGGVDNKLLVDLKEQGKKLISQMEQYVDPFDLDVFMPHMEVFIKRHISRTSLLISCFFHIDKHALQVRTSNYDEQHSAVPLLNNPPRFMLLPVSIPHADDEEETEAVFDYLDERCSPLSLYERQTNIHETLCT